MLGLLCAALLAQPAEARLPKAAKETALASTVHVYNPKRSTEATAVILEHDGATVYVLTAAHVVGGAERLTLDVADTGQPNGRRVLGEATVLDTAKDADLALLKIVVKGKAPPGIALRPRKLGSPKLPAGAFSLGDDGTKATIDTETIVAALLVKRPGASVRCWKCAAPPVPGRSGGPLLDADGALMGICSGGQGSFRYFVHLDEVRPFLKNSGVGHLVK